MDLANILKPVPPPATPRTGRGANDTPKDMTFINNTPENIAANMRSASLFSFRNFTAQERLPLSRPKNSKGGVLYDDVNDITSEPPVVRKANNMRPPALPIASNANPLANQKIKLASKFLEDKEADQVLFMGDDSITITTGGMSRMLKKSNLEYLSFTSNYRSKMIEEGRNLLGESGFDFDHIFERLIALIMKIQSFGMDETARRRAIMQMVRNLRQVLDAAGLMPFDTESPPQKERPEVRRTPESKSPVASNLNGPLEDDWEDTMLLSRDSSPAGATRMNPPPGCDKDQEREGATAEILSASCKPTPETEKRNASREQSAGLFVSPNAVPPSQKRKVPPTDEASEESPQSSHRCKKQRAGAERAIENSKSGSDITQPQTYPRKSTYRPLKRENFYLWPEIDVDHVIEDGKKRPTKLVNYSE